MTFGISPQDPHLWSFHFIRGCSRYFAGDLPGAIDDEKTAIQNKANEYLPFLALACVLVDGLDRVEEAHEAFRSACRIKPEISEHFLRATIINLHPPYLESYLSSLKKLGLATVSV